MAVPRADDRLAVREHDARARRRQAFASLLRSRRGRLQPADVGLIAGGRRRTPGLRREEVAVLADVSTTYYTFLEQGRDVQPSAEVVSALARALRFTEAEAAQLHQLARDIPPTELNRAPRDPARLSRIVDALLPHPAYGTNDRWDVVATNTAANQLFPFGALAPVNLLEWTFCDSRAREFYADWQAEARGHVARFRSVADSSVKPDVDELITALRARSAEFDAMWRLHDVAPSGLGTCVLRTAEGDVEHLVDVTTLADMPDHRIVVFFRVDQAIERGVIDTPPTRVIRVAS